MARDRDDFDPDAPEEREVGREIADESSGFGSIVGHLYRGEVDRAVNWRTRLDSTTNWAVTIIAAILAYAFSSDEVDHSILLVAMVIGVVFLFIEARRYQRYDVWRSRVRSLQENLFADALDPSRGVEQRDWRRKLSENYRRPEMQISLRAALSHRLKRVYLPLLVGLLLVWLFRLNGTGDPLPEAASVSNTPGSVVLGSVLFGYICLFVVAFWPRTETPSEMGDKVDSGDIGSRRD